MLGNVVLPIRSCLASDSATEKGCELAFDEVTTQTQNGWVNHPTQSAGAPSWAIFNIGGGPEVNRVGIYTGIGKKGHSINDFKIEIKAGGAFVEVTRMQFMKVGSHSPQGVEVTGNRG